MGLKIDTELREKYKDFYSLALVREEYEGALVLSALTTEAVKSLTCEQMCAELLVIKKSPQLTDLGFLENFKALRHVAVFGCPNIISLWDMTKCSLLTGVALTGCKRLHSLDAFGKCAQLTNILLDCGVLNRTKPDSLKPLTHCKQLKTLDLAFAGVKDRRTFIDFDAEWPQLDSLTVSTKIRKYFISTRGK